MAFQFRLPAVPYDAQLTVCLSIMEKLHKEVLPLRKKTRSYELQFDHLREQIQEWKEKYRTTKDELRKTQKENTLLKKEKNRLETEIEKLTASNAALAKTNKRYSVALFDHGNFKHKEEDTDKKEKGGQTGHPDTNREKTEDYSSFKRKRIFARTCGKCGCSLKRVKGIRKKILLDIVINPEIVKLIIESERQWCNNCRKEVSAKDPQTLPFTEYGINTFMMAMILRFSCHSSMGNIAKVLQAGYGLSLSKSDVASLLKSGGKYLDKKYEELKQAIRTGAVMYNDETGWLVHGQKAWMWIMANETATVYVAAESRGKGIFEEMYGDSSALSMHDGYSSYESVTGKERAAYCWSHVLRFAFEETVKLLSSHLACQIRDRLVDLYRTIRANPSLPRTEKETLLRQELDSMISIQSTDQTVVNILHRVRTQKEGLILALLDTPDGTNNLAERELRNMSIKRTISYGSDTHKGMEITAIIGSVIQTLNRNKEFPFIPALKTCLTEGVQKKCRQYIHTAYYDS